MPKKRTDLTSIEEAHGFVFGDPTGEAQHAPATIAGTASCVNPQCTNRTVVHVHADTPLPLHCGTCFHIIIPSPDSTDASLHTVNPADEEAALDHLAERVAAKLRHS